VCRLVDKIYSLEGIISGEIIFLGPGTIWIGDEKKRKEYIQNMNPQIRATSMQMKKTTAPRLLLRAKKLLKRYLVDENIGNHKQRRRRNEHNL
jgi:hypothetical protein